MCVPPRLPVGRGGSVGHLALVTNSSDERGIFAEVLTLPADASSERGFWLSRDDRGVAWDWLRDIPMRVSYLEGGEEGADGEMEDGELTHFDATIIATSLDGFELQAAFTEAPPEWVNLMEDDWAWLDCDAPSKEVLVECFGEDARREAVLRRAGLAHDENKRIYAEMKGLTAKKEGAAGTAVKKEPAVKKERSSGGASSSHGGAGPSSSSSSGTKKKAEGTGNKCGPSGKHKKQKIAHGWKDPQCDACRGKHRAHTCDPVERAKRNAEMAKQAAEAAAARAAQKAAAKARAKQLAAEEEARQQALPEHERSGYGNGRGGGGGPGSPGGRGGGGRGGRGGRGGIPEYQLGAEKQRQTKPIERYNDSSYRKPDKPKSPSRSHKAKSSGGSGGGGGGGGGEGMVEEVMEWRETNGWSLRRPGASTLRKGWVGRMMIMTSSMAAAAARTTITVEGMYLYRRLTL